jgi:hypothetical protein
MNLGSLLSSKLLLSGLLAFLLLVSPRLSAQVDVLLTADTSELRIGETLAVELQVSAPLEWEIQWPRYLDTLGGFEILEAGPIDQTESNGRRIQRQQLSLITFDSGAYRIPPQVVSYFKAGDTAVLESRSNPLLMQVYTVVVDTTSGIKPIKEVVAVPITTAEVLSWAGLVLLLLLIGFGIYWWRKKQQNKPVVETPKVVYKVPPHETAMRGLSQLESQRLWQQGETKAYYIQLTEIIRTYIEAKFDVPALESITHEILRDLREVKLEEKQVHNLGELLEIADLAKFAKLEPDSDRNLQAIETSREFVKRTQNWAAVVATPPALAAAPEPTTESVPAESPASPSPEETLK